MSVRQRLSAMCPNPPDIVVPIYCKGLLMNKDFRSLTALSLHKGNPKNLQTVGKTSSRFLLDSETLSDIRNSTAAADIAQGCALRLIKLSGGAELDDWGSGWLPSYTLIYLMISIHEVIHDLTLAHKA